LVIHGFEATLFSLIAHNTVFFAYYSNNATIENRVVNMSLGCVENL